ncbi:hypothetical protein BpHYR1_003855 [Brachionus plicatilis]|uniref:Uncharacterized protein n=1 Tax=Brachionus plicatilis TaxID=10195 RepID=A0A3M7P9T8_BRAPC|nr:hypothetical protein BpHYR1_003855 [Brachionus plicatilis]
MYWNKKMFVSILISKHVPVMICNLTKNYHISYILKNEANFSKNLIELMLKTIKGEKLNKTKKIQWYLKFRITINK